MKQQHGYILWIVLIFMQLFALLGMHAMTATILQYKVNSQLFQHAKYFYQAEKILRQVERQSIKNNRCRIPISHPSQLTSAPLKWWQVNGCAGIFEKMQYKYVVEALGNDPCSAIANSHSFKADYYRLTLLVLAKQADVKMMLQSTFITPVKTTRICTENMRQVKLGRQTWREIL